MHYQIASRKKVSQAETAEISPANIEPSRDESIVASPVVDLKPPDQAKGAALTQLPKQLGDPIAIRAELHYLHVTATNGEITVLGTMTAVDRQLADQGVRVHRSFWVATAHVRRMIKSRYGWSCELSNGNKVPVSRRRLSDVRLRLGLLSLD